jgi:hypothetical protein
MSQPRSKNRKGRFGPGRNSLLAAENTRGKRLNNIWKQYSARNRSDEVLHSDPESIHFLWLEGSEELLRYKLEPGPFIVYVDGKPTQTWFDAHVEFRNGRIQLREVKEGERQLSVREEVQRVAQIQAAQVAGAEYVRITCAELDEHRCLIQNWRRALPYLAACRRLVLEPRCTEVASRLSVTEATTLGQLLVNCPADLHSIYVAAVLKLIQDGRVRSD